MYFILIAVYGNCNKQQQPAGKTPQNFFNSYTNFNFIFLTFCNFNKLSIIIKQIIKNIKQFAIIDKN